jgi:hypothetical protein
MHSPRIHRRARSDAQARPALGRRGFQIGPRIRIGGTVGKIGQNVKNAVTKGATDVGHAVGKVASNPLTQGALAAALAATGVGAPAAAAIMAGVRGGGALLTPGGNIGDGLKGAATGAAMGYGASKVGGILRGGGGIGGVLGRAGSAIGGAAGTLGKGAGAVTDALHIGDGAAGGGTSDLLKLLGLAGAGVAGVSGYNDAKKAGAAQDAALARNTGIAGQLQQHGTELLNGARPIRQAGEANMQQLLARGRRATPQLPAFRSPFAPMVPPPPGV